MEKNNKNQEGVSILENILILYLYTAIFSFFKGGFSFLLNNAIGFKITMWTKLVELILSIVIEILFIKFYVNYAKINLDYKKTKSYKIYIWLLVIIIGYIWFYDNSIGIILNKIIKQDIVSETIKESLKISPVITFISAVIIAPIFEEIVFRGLILKGLLKRYNYLKAILVSSIFFGIVHFNIIQGIYTFFLGLILAIVYYKTKSLFPCIFFHSANNFIYVLSLYDYKLKIESSNFSLVEIIMGVVILISSYFMYRKFIKNKKDEKNNITI